MYRPLPDRVAIGIPADTLRQRPDVHAAEQRITAEAARLSSAKTTRLPQFSLTGSIGTEIVAQAATGGIGFVASAAASVLQTVFDGGRIRQQIAVQSAVVDQRVEAYQSTLLTALEDVENALVALETSRQRLDSLQSAQRAAEEAAQLAQTQYAAGLADFERVLDTQRTVLSVQDSVATTQGDRTTALVQLFKALGGGWAASSDSGSVSRSDVQ
ncbi:MAG: TolC family protein [Vicinamibacterales bacterium]